MYGKQTTTLWTKYHYVSRLNQLPLLGKLSLCKANYNLLHFYLFFKPALNML